MDIYVRSYYFIIIMHYCCLTLTLHFTNESSTLQYHEMILQPPFNLIIKRGLIGVQGLDHCVGVQQLFCKVFVAKMLTCCGAWVKRGIGGEVSSSRATTPYQIRTQYINLTYLCHSYPRRGPVLSHSTLLQKGV